MGDWSGRMGNVVCDIRWPRLQQMVQRNVAVSLISGDFHVVTLLTINEWGITVDVLDVSRARAKKADEVREVWAIPWGNIRYITWKSPLYEIAQQRVFAEKKELSPSVLDDNYVSTSD